MKEYILCAAIWYKEIPLKKVINGVLPKNCNKGLVILGHRHGQCMWTIGSLLGLRTVTFAKDGTFLQEYISLREAERQTGIHASSIGHSIKGRGYSKSAGGYLWSYEKLQSHSGYIGQVGKIIQQFTLDDTFIEEFESICSAAKQLNISKSGIIRCCKNKQKQCGGFTFKYITNENI